MATSDMFNFFFEAERNIHRYFGYVEDWVKIPLADYRDMYWILNQESNGSGEVLYYEHKLTQDVLDAGDYYASEIYTQRFLPKWVYETNDYTLISMNPGVDGNKYLGIFDNKKRNTNVSYGE